LQTSEDERNLCWKQTLLNKQVWIFLILKTTTTTPSFICVCVYIVLFLLSTKNGWRWLDRSQQPIIIKATSRYSHEWIEGRVYLNIFQRTRERDKQIVWIYLNILVLAFRDIIQSIMIYKFVNIETNTGWIILREWTLRNPRVIEGHCINTKLLLLLSDLLILQLLLKQISPSFFP